MIENEKRGGGGGCKKKDCEKIGGRFYGFTPPSVCVEPSYRTGMRVLSPCLRVDVYFLSCWLLCLCGRL